MFDAWEPLRTEADFRLARKWMIDAFHHGSRRRHQFTAFLIKRWYIG